MKEVPDILLADNRPISAGLISDQFFGKRIWLRIRGQYFEFPVTDEQWLELEKHLEQKT